MICAAAVCFLLTQAAVAVHDHVSGPYQGTQHAQAQQIAQAVQTLQNEEMIMMHVSGACH